MLAWRASQQTGPMLLAPLTATPSRKAPSVIRVLIVDDHEFFRQCLVQVVSASEGLEAVGECTDGSEVVAVRSLEPDVVVMDVRMAGMSGLEAAAALQREGARSRVIMLTSDTADSSRAAARAHGALGYLVKGGGPDVVVDAIRGVAAGGTAWPEQSQVAFS
jgi:DNA-binding NarL/FixJ family response regulator